MFTGIIKAIGTIGSIEAADGDVVLRIDCDDLDFDNVSMGDSIAVNGVCLTVVEFNGKGFSADVSRETLGLTTLGGLVNGGSVNLEPAINLSTPLGGHLVSGHVDGMGQVVAMDSEARQTRFTFSAPAFRSIASFGTSPVP